MRRTIKYASVCSGIEAATVAWKPLDWQCAFVAEIEKFPCEVLKYRHPEIPNYGDITKFKQWPVEPIDVLIGGTPCQSFSVAGLRKGMDDPRGNLAFAFLGIAARFAPRWIVFENVPGLLSVDQGRAFGSLLGGLADIGYGFAYTVLDSQYFHLAQRRERVFLVGHIGGNWQRPAAVLFDRESMSGNPAPSRKAGEGVAPTISARTKGGGGLRTDAECDGAVIAEPIPIQEIGQRQSGTSMNGVGHGMPGDPMYTLQSGSRHGVAVPNVSCPITGSPYGDHESRESLLVPEIAYALQERDSKGSDSNTKDGHLIPESSGIYQWASGGGNDIKSTAQALRAGAEHSYQFLKQGMAVRRLTPRECERLQGFHDDYTAIPRGKKTAAECPDGPRYKALGNSMSVPVIRWLGERIQMTEELFNQPLS